MSDQQTITLCLGHDVRTDRPGCPKANDCLRHRALWARQFPAEAPITGAACSTLDYALFFPVEAVPA